MEREKHSPKNYIIIGLALLLFLFMIKSCGGTNEPTYNPTPPQPTVTVTQEPSPTEEASDLPTTPGEAAGQKARDTLEELKQFGEDFLDGFNEGQTSEPSEEPTSQESPR